METDAASYQIGILLSLAPERSGNGQLLAGQLLVGQLRTDTCLLGQLFAKTFVRENNYSKVHMFVKKFNRGSDNRLIVTNKMQNLSKTIN